MITSEITTKFHDQRDILSTRGSSRLLEPLLEADRPPGILEVRGAFATMAA
jgi:hypothetical protein